TPVKGPEMTYEVRYRINSSMGVALDTGLEEVIQWPTTGVGAADFAVFPIQFHVTGNHPSIPGWRIWIGYANHNGDENIDGYYFTHMNEGIGSLGGSQQTIAPEVTGPPPFDTWQTLRMTERYDPTGGPGSTPTGEINVYLNSNPTPIATFDLDGVNPFPCCSRSLGMQRNGGGGSSQGGDNPDPKWEAVDYRGMEVAFDYIRIVDRVIPITEALNAPGGGGCIGNVNGDGTTDGADVAIIYNAWGTNNAQADLTKDGIVDGADLAEVFNCWGQADVAPVPEPASLGILGMGLVGLLASRRQSK
ncbi:MAG: PEP-CTERM sorting domain-containing protein, partial [Planctomycetota bacterium]|nr:PEP-CTERM sorting domain-containing protein [Planctomycetota bacterium]